MDKIISGLFSDGSEGNKRERIEKMKILIQNGHVLDPLTKRDGRYDVLVKMIRSKL